MRLSWIVRRGPDDGRDLTDFVKTLAGAHVAITMHSGPLHVAAALGVPVIGLAGPTAPAWDPPGASYCAGVSNANLAVASGDRPVCVGAAIRYVYLGFRLLMFLRSFSLCFVNCHDTSCVDGSRALSRTRWGRCVCGPVHGGVAGGRRPRHALASSGMG